MCPCMRVCEVGGGGWDGGERRIKLIHLIIIISRVGRDKLASFRWNCIRLSGPFRLYHAHRQVVSP